MYKVLLCILGLLASVSIQSKNLLFYDGHSNYVIVLSSDVSTSEKAAAHELQDYITQIGGVRIPIVSQPEAGKNSIFIGIDRNVSDRLRCPIPEDTAETFTYMTKDDDLYIFGGREMGTAYGVFSFLEQQMGVRWYSRDYTKVPRLRRFTLRQLNHTETPAFRYRHVLYYQLHHDPLLDAHNLLNMHLGATPCGDYAPLHSFWETHTFSLLLPPEEFFQSHPEYYSMWEGKRVPNGQLCLSNPHVIRLLATRLLDVIKRNPGYLAYSLAQNDNQICCECDACRQIEQRYGSHSGLLIWAVNQVAEEIDRQLPGTNLITLAYQYTRQAPKGILPRHNVFVRLCDIECCFLHPLDDVAENAAFMDDLKAWARLTDRLFVFDYVTNFAQYTAPYPNFAVMNLNLQTFLKNHVSGVMEEGQYESDGGEFAELKQWVLAKLMWNPHQEVSTLARQFISDYYGKSANDVWKYYKLCCELVRDDTHAKFNSDHNIPLYTDRFIDDGIRLLKKALTACRQDSVVTRRVEHLLLQPLYLQMKRQPAKAAVNGNISLYLRIVCRDNIRMREGTPLETSIREEGYI